MNTLTIPEHLYDEISRSLLDGSGLERAGYLLCQKVIIKNDPWTQERHNKYLAKEFRSVEPKDIIFASETAIEWQTDSLIRAMKWAQQEQAVLVVIHSHPNGLAGFSDVDDAADRKRLRLVQGKFGKQEHLLSMVLSGSGDFCCRAAFGAGDFEPFSLVKVIGDRFSLHYPGRGNGIIREEFDRQSLLFGQEFTEDMSKLRIGIIGLGGTGGPTALLLARMGSQQFAYIDRDKVERTNLGRLPYAFPSDIDKFKVDVASEYLSQSGLDLEIVSRRCWINDPQCWDILRSCDVIFCCTDDHSGRMFLNRFAYFYLVPVIDVGLDIQPAPTSHKRRYFSFDGRVTVVQPSAPCLLCYGGIDPKRAAEEDLQRKLPDEHARQVKERYVRGAGNPNPVVITYTHEVAIMAVQELTDRLVGYKDVPQRPSYRVRKFDRFDKDRFLGADNSGCHICDSQLYWGAGDVVPFLDVVA